MSAVFQGLSVAVLLGGHAAERSVSLDSGANVANALVAAGANVRRIDTRDEGWMAHLEGIDFVFNVLHGPGGEDGAMQGLLTHFGLPYSGSGVLGSALTMDKVRTKQVWQADGLPAPAFALPCATSHWQQIIDQLGTVFVKPAREGSSIGMSKASSASELAAGFATANRSGDEVLVEQFIAGDEYTVAILGDRALPSIRIEPAIEFYDFDAKYVSDETQFFCPSGLSATEEAALAELALTAFHTAGAAVWGRVDLLRDEAGQWQLLEVNTIPGMTSHSLVPMAAAAAGLTTEGLLAEIYRLSLDVRSHE